MHNISIITRDIGHAMGISTGLDQAAKIKLNMDMSMLHNYKLKDCTHRHTAHTNHQRQREG